MKNAVLYTGSPVIAINHQGKQSPQKVLKNETIHNKFSGERDNGYANYSLDGNINFMMEQCQDSFESGKRAMLHSK